MCGKLVAPVMPVFVGVLEQHHDLHLAPALRDAVVAASPATHDRHLHTLRRRHGRQPRRAATALARSVPKFRWCPVDRRWNLRREAIAQELKSFGERGDPR